MPKARSCCCPSTATPRRRALPLQALSVIRPSRAVHGIRRAITSRSSWRRECRPQAQSSALDERPLTATAIGYTLAPRINASGRMGCASLAGELLLTDDPARGEELSRALCDLNRERQAIEAEIYTECQAMAEALPQPQRHALVLAGEQWHQGVVGIVS